MNYINLSDFYKQKRMYQESKLIILQKVKYLLSYLSIYIIIDIWKKNV